MTIKNILNATEKIITAFKVSLELINFNPTPKKKVKNIIAGYIVQCLGHGKQVAYKKSRLGNSLADRAAINVLKNLNFPKKFVDFSPDGSDERQFCSPGFNLPIGSVMRNMYERLDGSKMDFKEYHTSLDIKHIRDGFYIVRVFTGDEKEERKLILKK